MNSNEAKTIKNAALTLIDELSTMNKVHLDLLDRFLRELTGLDQKMGGKLVLLMHVFRQTLTVVSGGSRGDIMYASVICNQ